MGKIKVLIVEDSRMFRDMLVRNLSLDEEIEVVGTAVDAFEAKEAIRKLRPDVITLDVELPKKSGIEFLKEFMPIKPIPTVVISALSNSVFDAMKAGAVEFVNKPSSMSGRELADFMKNELCAKVKMASTITTGKLKDKLILESGIDESKAPKQPIMIRSIKDPSKVRPLEERPARTTQTSNRLRSNETTTSRSSSLQQSSNRARTSSFSTKTSSGESEIKVTPLAATATRRQTSSFVSTASNRETMKPATTRSGRTFASSIKRENMVVAIGASTGGTEAILNVIKDFKKDIPGVVVVQHMPPGFTKMFADRLNSQCEVTVKEASDGDLVLPGQVLIAPGASHMRLRKVSGRYQVEVKDGEKVSGHRPSVDALFESVAETAGPNALGVILTGMGADGAKGMLLMQEMGAINIGQDEETCVVYGMPKSAYKIGAIDYQLPLNEIARQIYKLI